MRAAVTFVAVLALALAVSGDAKLFVEDPDMMPEVVATQRALKQTGSPAPPAYSPPVCLNAALPSQIVARVAILQFAKPGTSTDASYGVRLYVRALYNAFRDQNKLYGTKLKYSVKNYKNPGVVTNPAAFGASTQGWFYYYIVLDIGRCGAYKPGFIATLRSLIRKPRPGGSQIRRLRVINY